MIVINYFKHKDEDDFLMHLCGIVNENLDLDYEPILLREAIENDPEFKPKEDTLYELYLTRATIASDPVDEPAFAIYNVLEKTYSKEIEDWINPIVRL